VGNGNNGSLENTNGWVENTSNGGELWSNKVIKQKIDYVHNNPIEAGSGLQGGRLCL